MLPLPFLLFPLFMGLLIMKQCAGDSSESRKCFNLSPPFHVYTAARERLFITWQRGEHNSMRGARKAFNGALRKQRTQLTRESDIKEVVDFSFWWFHVSCLGRWGWWACSLWCGWRIWNSFQHETSNRTGLKCSQSWCNPCVQNLPQLPLQLLSHKDHESEWLESVLSFTVEPQMTFTFDNNIFA